MLMSKQNMSTKNHSEALAYVYLYKNALSPIRRIKRESFTSDITFNRPHGNHKRMRVILEKVIQKIKTMQIIYMCEHLFSMISSVQFVVPI